MEKRYFSVKDIALISVLGCISALTTPTTMFIPAPLPGLYGIISIPISIMLTLLAVEIVGKFGAATFTQLISAAISTLLPGGPPVVWVVVPAWCLGGIIIDVTFYLFKKRPSQSMLAAAVAGLFCNVPGDFILYWSFVTFLSWGFPLIFFLYGFLAIHMILGGMAGVFAPSVIERIAPLFGQANHV